MTPLVHSPRRVLFWTLAVALISSISTVIFSEGLMHDRLGASVIILSVSGLIIYGLFSLIDTVLAICNP